MHNVEVSPKEPGIRPRNMSHVVTRGGNLPERCGTGETVGNFVSEAENRVVGNKHAVAAHFGWISEEEECTGHQGYVENVVSCASEYLFYENHAERRGYGNHPQRGFYRAYHGDEYAGDKKALLDFLSPPLGHGEFNSEAYNIGNRDAWKNGQKTVEHQ